MKIFYLFCQILRSVLAPIMAVAAPRVSFLRERWQFEQQNLLDQSGFFRSFHKDQQKAERTYQVSSEGEWEQAWPFILADMNDQLKVELIYTSPSLERRVKLSMASCEVDKIRFFRLPLLCYFPWSFGPWQNINDWCSASELVLCRYDFYPELMLRGPRMKRFVLLSASLKSKRSLLNKVGTASYLFLQAQYRFFHQIFLSSLKEKNDFLSLGIHAPTWAYEARGLQISLRLKNSALTFDQRAIMPLVEAISSTNPSERLIFGSAWSEDLEALRSLPKVRRDKLAIVIAPHQLKMEKVELMQKEMGPEFTHFIYNGQQNKEQLISAFERGDCVWVVMPGLLLELYSLFPFVFVGGGFGRSVHSVLEPYLAQSTIFCGPKTHRSTEVEIIEMEDPERLIVLQNAMDFASAWQRVAQMSLAATQNISYYERLYERERESFQKARLFFLGHYTGEQ